MILLIDKYLPAYDYKEFHSLELNSSTNGIYQKMLECDFSNSSLTKFLFRLRGLPKKVYSIEHLSNMGFIKLEEEPGKEILFGMITDNPTFSTCQSNISPSEFIHKSDATIIKAVINFKVESQDISQHILSTETRVWCGSKQMKSRFKWYWFFIKPFSKLIRKSLLRQMKHQILQVSPTTLWN